MLRTSCPRCARAMEFQRMREHLRDAHHLESAELDAALLVARREAVRGPVHTHS